ncbi:MAG: DUF445 family protein [Cyanobacteria bacterium HKST-UBA02]|nr:DUF445 family protein [Cyanobacteria bacterium HKST-UBA02]
MSLGFDFHSLFASPEALVIKVFLPPILYGAHGFAATWFAVKMLFRPYKAWFIPYTRIQIPFTPGIFPKRQAKLSQAVASTITDTLLTPKDIKQRADELVTEENIYNAINLFFDSVLLKEFRDAAKLHRLAADLAAFSPTLLQHFVRSLIDSLESGKDSRIPAITEKIFDQIVMSTRINLDQATELSSRIIENFLTPEKIRNALISLLSPQNIGALEESINVHAGGPYRLLARLIGVKRVCYEWRNFLEKEPDEAHKIISDLIARFGIKHQLAIQIANFDLRAMPLENINRLKQNVITFVEDFVVEHKEDIIEACKKFENEAMVTVQSAIVRFNPDSVPPDLLEKTKRNLASFTYSYLKRELGQLLEQAIPKLGVHGLIVSKIDLFTPMQLEYLVKRICKNELKALEYFGGVIGAVMGIIQILINAITF